MSICNYTPTQEEIENTLISRHGLELHTKFKNASVAICGLGGLGSNIAIALARAGIGRLHLIDFDKVDLSNIHRQQYLLSQIGMYKTDAIRSTLQAINPYIDVISDMQAVTEENITKLLEHESVICEAFDNPQAKAMLVNTISEIFPQKYIVSASGMAGISSANSITTRKITEHFYLCGDGMSDIADDIGLISARVMVCAAHQAHAILRIVAGVDIFE